MHDILKGSASLKLNWRWALWKIMYKKGKDETKRSYDCPSTSRNNKIIIINTNAINLNFTLCCCCCLGYSLIVYLLFRSSSVRIKKKEGRIGKKKKKEHIFIIFCYKYAINCVSGKKKWSHDFMALLKPTLQKKKRSFKTQRVNLLSFLLLSLFKKKIQIYCRCNPYLCRYKIQH